MSASRPDPSLSPQMLQTICWSPGSDGSITNFTQLAAYLQQPQRSICVVSADDKPALAEGGVLSLAGADSSTHALPLSAWLPAMQLCDLGDAHFLTDHNIQLPCMAGSMANGIASTELVTAMGRAGMLASFGAAGLPLEQIEAAIVHLQQALPTQGFASNLIHSPQEAGKEDATVDLYLRHGIQQVEASAYIRLTPAVVRYRLQGICAQPDGSIHTPNQIIAKASREEVATHWLSPPPAEIVTALLAAGKITDEQARLASHIPMAQDLTAEADSGGHTDNRPALVLLPAMVALRDRLQTKYRYPKTLRIGAAGGIATPQSAAAAFTIGAAYIVTGSINQTCTEAGTSNQVRELLAQAKATDVMMAPAVDMFEMGVKLQVLKRGTMFALRANRLWELYRRYPSLEALPAAETEQLEKNVLHATLTEVWQQTREFFSVQDAAQLQRAENDPKHKMALVFRWYLGLSSHWANTGVAARQTDYQVWTGPAIGAFNAWCDNTFLADPTTRKVALVNLNILHGAAVQMRINHLRQQGLHLPTEWCRILPQRTLTN